MPQIRNHRFSPIAVVYRGKLFSVILAGFPAGKQTCGLAVKSAFYYHCCESVYTLAYIDKMWGILRREAFSEYLRL